MTSLMKVAFLDEDENELWRSEIEVVPRIGADVLYLPKDDPAKDKMQRWEVMEVGYLITEGEAGVIALVKLSPRLWPQETGGNGASSRGS